MRSPRLFSAQRPSVSGSSASWGLRPRSRVRRRRRSFAHCIGWRGCYPRSSTAGSTSTADWRAAERTAPAPVLLCLRVGYDLTADAVRSPAEQRDRLAALIGYADLVYAV